MEDDEDNEGQEQEDDCEEESSRNTYSKKKHFGKLEKDLKGRIKFQAYYRPRNEFWKQFSFNYDCSKLTVTHRKQIDDFKSTTKLKASATYDARPSFNELTSKISKKVWGNTMTLSSKINSSNEMTAKFSHSVNLWERLKVKYGLEVEKKKEVAYGGSLGFSFSQSFASIPFFSFVSKYNHTFNLNNSIKNSKFPKWDLEYKGHVTTRDNHRFYLADKLTFDRNSKTSPISQTITFNAQDGDSIATLNTSIQLQKLNIKSKEVRFLIEFDKRYRFGVQKKNNIYEFLVERYRMNQKWLKSVKISAGNKGFLTTLEGKINIWKSVLDYSLNLRVKPGGGNFYNDFSSNLNLKWNL